MGNRPVDDDTHAAPFALVGETDFGALSEQDDRLRAIEAQLSDGRDRMDHFEKSMEAMRKSVDETRKSVEDGNDVTFEIRDFIKSGKTIFNAISWSGKTLTKIAVLLGKLSGAALAIYGVYYAFTHPGSLPPK